MTFNPNPLFMMVIQNLNPGTTKLIVEQFYLEKKNIAAICSDNSFTEQEVRSRLHRFHEVMSDMNIGGSKSPPLSHEV